MKRSLMFFIVASLLAATVAAQAEQIGTRQWRLVRLNGSNIGEPTNAHLQLSPDETRVTGNAGCNRMFGSVEVRGGRIAFSKIGTTRMACADARTQRIESAFLNALSRVDRFRRTGNTLDLFEGRRLLVRLKGSIKSPPDDPGSGVRLEDKKWNLDAIKGVAVPTVGRGAFVVFDPTKGSAGGDSSCNVFGGSYTSKGDALRITEIMSTMRACVEDERMSIERDFLDGLRNANRYEIRNARLLLYRDKNLLLTFTGAPK